MKINTIYMQQQRAARRVAEFVNRHPAAVGVAGALVTAYSAYFVFMNA